MKKKWLIILGLLVFVIVIIYSSENYLKPKSNKATKEETEGKFLSKNSIPSVSSLDLEESKNSGILQDSNITSDTELLDTEPQSVFSLNADELNNYKDSEKIIYPNEGFSLEDIDNIPQEILEAEIKDLNVDAIVESGFTKEGAENMASNDPKNNTISIEDMPQELKDSIIRDFEKSKKNGYDDISDKDASEITGIFNYILGADYPIPKLNFQPSSIPTVVSSEFSYVGYTYPNAFISESNEGNYDTVRRIFQSNSSSDFIILEETSLQNGGANLIEEFVNSSVLDYPSIFSIKRSPSGNTYSMLSWASEKYAYSLYQVGSLKSSRDFLISLGSDITDINIDPPAGN